MRVISAIVIAGLAVTGTIAPAGAVVTPPEERATGASAGNDSEAPRKDTGKKKAAVRHGPVGWETYRNPERLAEIATDSQTRQFSSFDRNGGNDDGFVGTFSCLSTTDKGCLIAEHDGAGEIDSIWFTRDGGDVTRTGNIRIELDGKTVVDANVQDVVNGKLGAPFTYPLVANADQSSGGVYIKVPMPYRNTMRVYTQNNPLFHHVTYRRFATNEGIATFDPSDPAQDVVDKLGKAGTQDPKPQFPDASTDKQNLDIAPGQSQTVAELTGPGAITALNVTLPQLTAAPTKDVVRKKPRTTERGKEKWLTGRREPATPKQAGPGEEVLHKARLRISFDGGQTVDSPLGEFFGSGLGLYPVKSLMFGMDPTNKSMTAWWLMPYAENTKVEIYNGSDTAITGEANTTSTKDAQWQEGLQNKTIGHFRATSTEKEATLTRDHDFLDATGRGRVVGVTQTVHGINETGNRRNYLEGDERIFVDGSASPDLHGTGTEDFYEGGWYFNRGSFSAPMNGSPVADRDDCKAACTGMYRLLLAEGMNFGSGMRFGIEHGPGDDEPAIEASTTYWYGQNDGTQQWTDTLDVGNEESEKAHGYTSTDPGERVENTSRYEGLDGPSEPAKLDGRTTEAPITFKLATADDNTGVILRRASDQENPFQTATVQVDGKEAGIWRQPLSNKGQRWLDDFHPIPSSLTTGKAELTVTLTPQGPWNATAYEAISTRPAYNDQQNPETTSNLTATATDRTDVTLNWTPAKDDIHKPGYEVYASTTPGFEPSKDTLVGTTRTSGFVHDAKQIDQQWYYRVRAQDAKGNSGEFSDEATAKTGRTLRIETELLLPPKSTTAPVQLQGNCCGVIWSGNAQLWFTPTTAGNNVVVEFEAPRDGTYKLTTQQTLARDYGINTLAIDGEQIGQPYDAYTPNEVKLSGPLDYGTRELTQGKHTLTIAVPDKHADAVSFMAGIDYLQLDLTG